MSARALMFQGTGSDVGKSTIVAGLCRIAHRRGLKVAPFKAQNMSNNAAVCAGGGEIGRAQALQARAAGLAPSVDMNPVLLKPQSDCQSQIVVQGKALTTLDAIDFAQRRSMLMGAVKNSFFRLAAQHDLILVEGAGSPAEINLRGGDIANMGFAAEIGTPVVLVGDIDRGGVIASLVGTQAVLDPTDSAFIQGFLINRFRGDPALFDEGRKQIIARTGWRDCGLVRWQPACARLPAEDAVVLERPKSARNARIKIAAPMLSRIANFDDLDPLKAEPNVDVAFVPPGQPLPREADVVILLGTKSSRADLAFLRAQGWDIDIVAHVRAGGRVLGLCGGLQVLGRTINDPDGVDGAPGISNGLGLLNIETTMLAAKIVRPASGVHLPSGASVAGYEIHVGRSNGADCARPYLRLGSEDDGARSADGRVAGTYLHGLFASDAFRSAWLEEIAQGTASTLDFEAGVEAALDELAYALERELDVDGLLAMAAAPGWRPA
jgi:adenosylcobyric acid synthase